MASTATATSCARAHPSRPTRTDRRRSLQGTLREGNAGMATGQPGIFAQGTRSHYSLELDLRPGAAIADVAAAVVQLREPKVTAGGLNLIVGFGADLWAQMA